MTNYNISLTMSKVPPLHENFIYYYDGGTGFDNVAVYELSRLLELSNYTNFFITSYFPGFQNMELSSVGKVNGLEFVDVYPSDNLNFGACFFCQVRYYDKNLKPVFFSQSNYDVYKYYGFDIGIAGYQGTDGNSYTNYYFLTDFIIYANNGYELNYVNGKYEGGYVYVGKPNTLILFDKNNCVINSFSNVNTGNIDNTFILVGEGEYLFSYGTPRIYCNSQTAFIVNNDPITQNMWCACPDVINGVGYLAYNWQFNYNPYGDISQTQYLSFDVLEYSYLTNQSYTSSYTLAFQSNAWIGSISAFDFSSPPAIYFSFLNNYFYIVPSLDDASGLIYDLVRGYIAFVPSNPSFNIKLLNNVSITSYFNPSLTLNLKSNYATNIQLNYKSFFIDTSYKNLFYNFDNGNNVIDVYDLYSFAKASITLPEAFNFSYANHVFIACDTTKFTPYLASLSFKNWGLYTPNAYSSNYLFSIPTDGIYFKDNVEVITGYRTYSYTTYRFTETFNSYTIS